MHDRTRPLAVVTGASSGIGLELARLAAENRYDLIVAADRPLGGALAELEAQQVGVQAVEADLATPEGVGRVEAAIGGRTVSLLLANAGHGLGGAFLDQEFDEVRHVIDTNVTGTIDLIQRVGRRMRTQQGGRILITGSIAGLMPGSFQAVYNGTKAFMDSFSYALREELKETGVSVTCLMPGATDTEFFARAGMEDTGVGAGPKEDPASVARTGWAAMMKGEAGVVSGLKNKLQATMTNVVPDTVLAERHRKMAEPGSAER